MLRQHEETGQILPVDVVKKNISIILGVDCDNIKHEDIPRLMHVALIMLTVDVRPSPGTDAMDHNACQPQRDTDWFIQLWDGNQ